MCNLKEKQLEELLEQCAKDPELRSTFIHRLLESKIYIVTISKDDTEKANMGKTEDELHSIFLKSLNKDDGSIIIPFFTSMEKLTAVFTEPETYYQLLKSDSAFCMRENEKQQGFFAKLISKYF